MKFVLLLTVIFMFQSSYCYYYRTETFTVPVDHFNFGNNKTFQIRYLINDTFWHRNGGPIFFYTGNEGDIELFAENTGFVWELAPSFQALVVFAEHRYYGHSLPFGNKSYSAPEYVGYLSSEQALADYVDLITYLRSNQTGQKSPVIAFGGSYGGMLAAYIRMKYPHIVAGSIASSAPIWQFEGITPCNAFYYIITSVYQTVNNNCSENIRRSWKVLRNLTETDNGRAQFSRDWRLCSPLKNETDVENILNWLLNVYVNLGMANYPYPANFLAELPAHPIKHFCQPLSNLTNGKPLLDALFKGLSVYFNYTGNASCLNYYEPDTPRLQDNGWDYQSCTEMVMPLCSDGIHDMFQPIPWNYPSYSDACYQKWKTRPQCRLAEKLYGGKDISAASNIVFSNGLLDPWSGGGVLKNISKTLLAVIIPEGAHHLDLRESNPADPSSVVQARKFHRKMIKSWIKQHFLES